MNEVDITLACGPYDRTEAIRNGVVRAEGLDIRYIAVQSPPELFQRAVKKQSFDVAEMSMSLYVQLRTRGELPYVALPVFPSRMFRHGYIFINTAAGITAPKDLEGKRVGVQEFHQTAGVWIRGLLADEYDVDLDRIRWYEGGVNAPRTPDVLDLRPSGDLNISFVGDHVSLNELLQRGDVDAYFGARKPAAIGRSTAVARLLPDYRRVEREYYERTGIHPMMHTLVVREDLLERYPWVAESLFKAFTQAKGWCLEQMRFSGTSRYTLPWLHADLEEVDDVFGGDPWPYGLEPNRTALEAFVSYLVDQRFLRSAVPLDDLFVPIMTTNE